MTSALRLLAVGILLIVGFQFAEAQDIRTDSLATDSIERAIDSILKETPVAPESLTVDLSEKALRKQKAPKRAKGIWTDRSLPDVWPEKVRKTHAHSKPVGLQRRLIEAVTE